MFCVQCGANLPDNARFCHVCGTQIVASNDWTAKMFSGDSDILELDAEKQQTDILNKAGTPAAVFADRMPDSNSLIRMIEQNAFRKFQKQRDEYNKYFFPCKEPFPASANKKYLMMKQIYRKTLDTGELLLFFYDNTLTGSGKESFVLTDRAIRFLSDRFASGMIPYNEIQNVEIQQIKFLPNLVINDEIVIPIRFLSESCYEFAEDFQNVMIPFLLDLHKAW